MHRFAGIFGINGPSGNEDEGPGSRQSDRSVTLYEPDIVDINGPEPCLVHEMELKFAEQKIHDLQQENRRIEGHLKDALQQVKDLRDELDPSSRNSAPAQKSHEHKQSAQTILAHEKTIKKMEQELADKTESQAKSEAEIAQLQATCNDRARIIDEQIVEMETLGTKIQWYYPKALDAPELFKRKIPLKVSDAIRRSTEQLSTTNAVLQKVNAEQLSTIQKLRSRIHELETRQTGQYEENQLPSTVENLEKSTVEQLPTIQTLRNRVRELEAESDVSNPGESINAQGKEETSAHMQKTIERLRNEVRHLKAAKKEEVKDLNVSHQQKVERLISERKVLEIQLKLISDDRDWHRAQHTRMLDRRSLSELENPTTTSLEHQLNKAKADISELKTGSPDVKTLQKELKEAKAEIVILKERVVKVITEIDLMESSSDVWRCDHQHGFARIDTETRFTRVVPTNVDDVINQPIKGFFHDQQFKDEYIKSRKNYVQHALMHERSGHGTVMRARDLDATFTKADEERGLPKAHYLRMP